MRWLWIVGVLSLGACEAEDEPEAGGTPGNDLGGGGFGGGAANVRACNRLAEAMDACSPGMSESLSCDAYADTDCNISSYFNCLEDRTRCDDGVLMPDGWEECAALATCE